MIQSEKDFCFCTLAIGSRYRLMAKELANSLAEHSDGIYLVVGTDEPKDFDNISNVISFKQKQKGIRFCYYDRRFVIEEALSKFRAVIVIDADSRIVANVPTDINWLPGITAGHCENLIEHVQTYNPERLEHLKKLALKLGLLLEESNYIGESLYIIARDEGRERDYLKYWGTMGNYLELKDIHSGEGNTMGLAAAKVGWQVQNEGWKKLKSVTKHIQVSRKPDTINFWEKLQRRLGYHYRLNKARIIALKDFDFYYR